MREPVVAISYAAGDESRAAILDVLGDTSHVVFLQDQRPSERMETLRRTEALIGWRLNREVSPDQFAYAARLRLIQFVSVGVDSVDFTAIPPGIVITGNAGAYARPMAEHVMAMTLSLAKRLPQRHAALAHGEFDQQAPSLTLDGAVCTTPRSWRDRTHPRRGTQHRTCAATSKASPRQGSSGRTTTSHPNH